MRISAPHVVAGLAATSFLLLAPALFAATAGADDAPTLAEIDAAGELFSSSCASCHLPPDPSHATDRAWLNQVRDTAWSSTPAKARVALIEYLNSTPLPLPEPAPLYSAARDERLDEGLGTVTPSFDEGDLFLEDADGRSFRLSWTGDEEADARARALPAGDYALRTYRIVQRSDDALWHVSATKLSIQQIEVTAGANVTVDIDDSIRIRSRLAGGRAQMSIRGDNGAGLSIYREGKRIPIDFRVIDDAGETLTSGSMRYGWGGGGWAPVESDSGQLELVYATPPFDVVSDG